MTPDIKERGGTVHVEYCPYCMSPVEGEKPCPSCGLTAGSYVSQSKHLPAGTILRERYLIGRVLGEGGFGITYIGRDLVLGLKVAIKEYFPTDKASRNAAVSVSVESFLGAQSEIFERGKQRFLQEARTMARLDRLPNIVSVRDFFEENSTAYIVMEYIDGTTLSELTKQRGGVMPAWELLHLIEPLFDSLSAMHELHLIHRDISPDNLMLEHGIIKLLDFGCAREAADGDATMTIMLRHGYAPLEQYQSSSGAQGAWTDVYALAATIYYCITGNKPPQAMDRIFEDTLVPPRKLGAELSVGQEQALMHALRVRPRERYQSVKEFHTALYEGVVTVRLEDGDEEQEISVAKGDVLKAAELPVPVKEGYIFTGWYTDENRQSRLTELTVKDGLTLYAGWRQRKKPENDRKRTKKPFWKNRVFQISAAAVAGVAILGGILGLALSGRPGTPGGASGPQNSSGPETSGPEEPSGQAKPRAKSVYSFEELMSCMADSNEYTVLECYGYDFIVNEPIEITKPVLIRGENRYVEIGDEIKLSSSLTFEGEVHFNSGRVTVAGEGANLIMKGGCSGEGFIRTRQGGKVTCSGDRRFYTDIMWLSDYSDLVTTDGAAMENGVTYIVFDEDEAFKNAVRVADSQMLRSATSNSSVESIIIDSDIRLAGGELEINKPLIIAEGATVTGDGSGLVIQNSLVNNGKITGQVGLRVEGGTFVNNGEVTSDMYIGIKGNAGFINNGTFAPMAVEFNDESFTVNFGNMTAKPGDGNCVNIWGSSTIVNYGEFEQSGVIAWIHGLSVFDNRGRVTVDGNLCNRGVFRNHGEVSISGILNNHAGVLDTRGGDISTTGGGYISSGIIMTTPDTRENVDRLNIDESCRVISGNGWSGDVWSVYTSDDLRYHVANDQKQFGIRVDGTISLAGDLTVDRDMAIPEGSFLVVEGQLTVRGCTLEVTGSLSARSVRVEDGGFISLGGNSVDPPALSLTGGDLVITGGSGGAAYSGVKLNGGKLIVSGGSGFVNSNDMTDCGGLVLDDNSTMYDLTNINLWDDAAVTVGDGCVLQSMNLNSGADYTVSEGGRLIVSGFFRLSGQGSITNRGELSITALNTSIERPIDNRGQMDIDAWDYTECYIRSEITNRGELTMAGDITVDDGGSIVNRNEIRYIWGDFINRGRVDNRGNFRGEEDFNLADPGDWSGNGVIR